MYTGEVNLPVISCILLMIEAARTTGRLNLRTNWAGSIVLLTLLRLVNCVAPLTITYHNQCYIQRNTIEGYIVYCAYIHKKEVHFNFIT